MTEQSFLPMKFLTIPSLVLLGSYALIALLAGCSKRAAAAAADSQALQPAVAEIAAAYLSYRKVTEREVYVNPELARLCRGASQQAVEATRESKGPHGNTAVLIYMNDTAAETFAQRSGTYEPGAVIVKHKVHLGYRDSKTGNWVRNTDNGVGGMVKRPPGFDPEHGDWEYFYFENASKIESGRIASCVKCHEAAKATDYVFGTWAAREKR